MLADQESQQPAINSSLINNAAVTVPTGVQEFEQLYIEEDDEVVKDILSASDKEDIEIIETSEQFATSGTINFANNLNNNTNQQILCYFAQSSTSFVCTLSIFSILLIGINQYFGVIHSLRYHSYITKCRSTVFIVGSWFVAIFFALLSSVTYNSTNNLWHFCQQIQQPSDTTKIFNTIYAFSYFVVVILVPFVAICVIYGCIYMAAHKNSERMRKSTSATNTNCLDYAPVTNNHNNVITIQNHDRLAVMDERRKSLPKVHSAPNFTHLLKHESCKDVIISTPNSHSDEINKNKVTRTCSDRNTNKFISTLKHKISNASVFRYREETRAAKISFLVIFMVLICYIPYGITLVLNSEYINIKTNSILHYLSLILLIFSNIISPFLFGYRNKRVKREIGKIFGITPPINQQTNYLFNERHIKRQNVIRNRSFEDIHEHIISEPFLPRANCVVPEVIITCKPEPERKSILKRVCNTTNWANYKKCNFITVPDSCISGEARGSFSSASTQLSNEE